MPIQNFQKPFGAVLAAFAALAWLPSPAQAQLTLTLSPSPVTAKVGDTGIAVFGSLTNSANAPVDFQTDTFNLLTGPSGANLGQDPMSPIAITFSGDNAPLTLAANQVYPGPASTDFTPLFLLDTDSSALPGTYTGTLSVTYGTQTTPEQNFTINLASPAVVPEAGTLPILALGVCYLFFAARRRRPASQH